MASNLDKYLTNTEHSAVNHAGLPGVSIDVQANGGSAVGPRARLNVITSGGAGVVVADNPGQNRIDITISAPAAGISAITRSFSRVAITNASGAFSLPSVATPVRLGVVLTALNGRGFAIGGAAYDGVFVAANASHVTFDLATVTIGPLTSDLVYEDTLGATVAPTNIGAAGNWAFTKTASPDAGGVAGWAISY